MLNKKLTASQLALKKQVEKITGATVLFEFPESEGDKYIACLAWERNTVDESDGEIMYDIVELSYLADNPQKNPMTDEQICAYPPELQKIFRSLHPDETCNVINAVYFGKSIEEVLKGLLEMSRLPDFGWHIGDEMEYYDPFAGPERLKSEEDELWEEYLEEKNGGEL